MKLTIQQVIPREICHYAGADLRITSQYNRVYVASGGQEQMIQLPGDGWKGAFSRLRLARRALRLDKCNVARVEDGLVVIRQGTVYHYHAARKEIRPALRLKNCRNVLHQSIAVIAGKELYFGEYGSNPTRQAVPVYRSLDSGKSWETIYEFPRGKIKHVHGCYFDPYTEKIWTLTGDYDGECYLLCSDRNFDQIEWIGDGSQQFRACNVFFEEEAVHWVMDSHLQDSYHIRLDRKTRLIQQKKRFPGPVWYIKRLEDGYYLAATAQEIGAGVKDRFAHLLVSQDLETWEDARQFPHDGLPKRYFKFGVIGFADGPQTSSAFYLFAEALRGLDGKTALCALEV